MQRNPFSTLKIVTTPHDGRELGAATALDWAPMKPARRIIPAPAWLRPVIRWATRVSMNAPAWVPNWLKNAPLKLTSLVLRAYVAIVR